MVSVGRLLADGDGVRLTDTDGAYLVIANAIYIGSWATSTAYVENDGVDHNSEQYRCILDHTSAASTEPGVGASWATYWEIMEGDLVVKEAPAKPSGISFNKATGALSWDAQNDASEWRIKANDKSEGTNGARSRAVGTVAYTGSPSVNDGALVDGESRSYEIRSFDDYVELEGPGAVLYPSASNRKL